MTWTTLSIYGQSNPKLKTNQQVLNLGVQTIGAGALMGGNSTHYWHRATAGQTAFGGTFGTRHFILCGFWQMNINRPTNVPTENQDKKPQDFKLQQNYPNPFNPTTTIRYNLPHSCRVTLEVINLYGQRVAMLMDQKMQSPGMHELFWDGYDSKGDKVSSGMYFYHIKAESETDKEKVFQSVKTMLFVK